MERNVWVDRIVDNIVRRSERDTVTKTSVVSLMLVLPAGIAALFSLYNIANHNALFDVEDGTYITVVSILMGECAIASFLLFTQTNRTRNHHERDKEWMEAFIGYVDSKGGDTRELRAIADREAVHRWKLPTAITSCVMLVIFCALGLLGVFMFMGRDPLDGGIMNMLTVCYVLLLAQYVFTIGTTSRFPARQDKVQCEFTEELSKQLYGIGIKFPPLDRSVMRMSFLLNAVLFVATLGLYSVVLLLLANHNTNKHIRAQWKYETDLMMKIVRHEGGIGIEGVGSNQPKNAILRFIKNAM